MSAAVAEQNQFSTFYVDGQLYGIDVGIVQEVTRAMPITPVPLAPRYVRGLINLRGQIATAISLRDLFGLKNEDSAQGATENDDLAHVVCRHDGHLIAFLVDAISDVTQIEEGAYETTPDTVSGDVACYLSGVYKLPKEILISLNVQKVIEVINEQGKAQRGI